MITALATPAAGALLPDANNTVIKIQSTNGEGYYFRAKIYINGELFDEQGWSRSDAFTATKDLKKLYHAYFPLEFHSDFNNLLDDQSHLNKLVNITIEEYHIDSGDLTGTLELPGFYIIYNTRPEAFSDATPLRLLGMDAAACVVPPNGKLSFSFFVSQEAGEVGVKLFNNFGTPLYEISAGEVAGKKVFLFHFNLGDVALSYNTLWVTAEITAGANTKKLYYRILRLPDNPVTEIAYRNNFGYYQYAYFDGELETDAGLSPETYETADGREVVYEITEQATYTINTGSLRSDEKAIMNMVATSTDCHLKHGSEWLPLVTKTKKITEYRERQNSYAGELQFTVARGTDVANTGLITVESPLPDIVITEFDVIAGQLVIHFVLNNGYAPTALTVQYRTSPTSGWLDNTGAPTSPRAINVPSGTYQVRLIDTNGISPSSDIADVIV